jgi:16S rRNA C1402 N4-methylase RsmH
VIPANLLERAGIGRDVTVAGIVDHLEIWDRAAMGASSSRQSKGARKMLPSVLPTETDHVPVLADEVLAVLAPRPAETSSTHLRTPAGTPAARRAAARAAQADRDRPRPDGRAVLRAAARSTPVEGAAGSDGEFSQVARAVSRRTASGADAVLLDLGRVVDAARRGPSAGSRIAADAALDMRMDPSVELTAARPS